MVHRLRSRVDGVLVGIGTLLADDPLLTSRVPRKMLRTPLRVIVDPKLATPLSARLFSDPGPVLIAAGERASKRKGEALKGRGAEVVYFPDPGGRFELGPCCLFGQEPDHQSPGGGRFGDLQLLPEREAGRSGVVVLRSYTHRRSIGQGPDRGTRGRYRGRGPAGRASEMAISGP